MRKVVLLLSALNLCGLLSAQRAVTPYYSIRSQGVNAAREMVGMEEYINLCDMCDMYGAFSITTEYSRSFKADAIARSLFGSDLRNCTLNISGSSVANRATSDWLADYFGLPTDFKSSITFKPSIQNFVIDLELYLGTDKWQEGSYFRVNMPLTFTKWSLKPCERIIDQGSNDMLAGYYAPGTLNRNQLLPNALAFFSGSTPDMGSIVRDFTIPGPALANIYDTSTTFNALAAARWSYCGTKTRFADIELVFGRNVYCCDDGFFGVSLRCEAPTGNKPRGDYLFEPIAGNGGHWTLGGGISAGCVLWHDDECGKSCIMYTDLNIVHLFRTCQTRTFDLCGKPNSRYMLAEKMRLNYNGTGYQVKGQKINYDSSLISETLQMPSSQFAQQFAPVANLTTRQVDVSAAVQGDLAIKVAYNHGNGVTCDLGYNLWGRTKEQIRQRPGCSPRYNINEWALKGDAFVYGFFQAAGVAFDNNPVALSATESRATIHSGTNFANGNTDITNLYIDNPLVASAIRVNTLGNVYAITNSTEDTDRAHTSVQPILLHDADIDFAGTQGVSQKIFIHLQYAGEQCGSYIPFIGAGASVEFGKNNDSCSPTASFVSSPALCNDTGCSSQTTSIFSSSTIPLGSTTVCSLSQWAVWLKGGVAFN